MTTIIRSPEGKDRREVHIEHIHIPDLWRIAMELKAQGMNTHSDMVLETWHIAHDLKYHILSQDD